MSDLLVTDNPFNADQIDCLKDIAQAMIPASATRPSAADAAIIADIIATAKPHAAGVIAALEEAQSVGLDAFSRSQSAACRTLISMVVQCYYRDDRVLESLGAQARPPFPQGHDIDEGDWSLLDPVKARGTLYKPV